MHQEQTLLQAAASGELMRGVVPVRSTFTNSDVVGVVVVNRFLADGMGRRVDTIRSALGSYRRLQPTDSAFRTSMLLLLSVIALVSLLFSSWMGFRLAKQVTDPIQRLADATETVASGDLSVRVPARGRHEIADLGRVYGSTAGSTV